MTHYFISRNNIKQGPFTLEEIQKQRLYETDLIWTSNDSNWKKIIDYPELLDLLIKKPPPTPIDNELSKLKLQVKENINTPLIIGGVIGIVGYFIASDILKNDNYSPFNEFTYYQNKETGLIQNMTRPIRAILLFFSKDINVYVVKSEDLFIKMMFFSLLDAFLIYFAFYAVKYFSIVNKKNNQ